MREREREKKTLTKTSDGETEEAHMTYFPAPGVTSNRSPRNESGDLNV